MGFFMRKQHRVRDHGTSLPELFVVLTIIGIMAALAVPSYRTMLARVQARSVTAEIASELRSARQLAMARRERVRVLFDREQRTLTLQRVDGEAVLRVYRYGDTGVVLDEPSAGPELWFHPSGRSATATTIRLRDRDGRETILTVSLTGRVSIS